jgi:hypothetical protein
MRSPVPEKIQRIIDDIHARGNVPVTRLTVLKKWFEKPHRMSAFGLWVARRSASRKGKTTGEFGALLDEARQLLGAGSDAGSIFQKLDRAQSIEFYERARQSQNQCRSTQWAEVRSIECWQLYLVEAGVAVHVGLKTTASDGYALAASLATNYDPKYGTGLNGPSVGKLEELIRFMFHVEALEDFESTPNDGRA